MKYNFNKTNKHVNQFSRIKSVLEIIMGMLPIFSLVNSEKVYLIGPKIYETCLQLTRRCLFL